MTVAVSIPAFTIVSVEPLRIVMLVVTTVLPTVRLTSDSIRKTMNLCEWSTLLWRANMHCTEVVQPNMRDM